MLVFYAFLLDESAKLRQSLHVSFKLVGNCYRPTTKVATTQIRSVWSMIVARVIATAPLRAIESAQATTAQPPEHARPVPDHHAGGWLSAP